jgi:RND family efflux transporter MFP subunit
MHSTDPNAHSAEALRRENDDLRRELELLRSPTSTAADPGWKPSKTTIVALTLFSLILIVVAFFTGYLPMQHRRSVVVAEARHQEEALPRVQVISVTRGGGKSALQLPASTQAIHEAPVLARTDGYLKARFADLGDRVKAGQPLAEIDVPELEDSLRGARATLEQSRAALEQSKASLLQGKADLEFAKVSAERYSELAKAGVASRHDDDRYRLEYQARIASVNALEKALNAQKSNVAAAEANVARIENLQAYKIVRAPFDGVITLRNVDAGALVSVGNTLLFRIAQTHTVRVYVSVPQSWVSSVRVGQPATVRVAGLPGRQFGGTVARTANALDPTSRTLLVELNVPNPDGVLMPGMSAQAELNTTQRDAPLVIPADALVIRANGSEVATVRKDETVHIRKIRVGRDYGDLLEVVDGLNEGDRVIQNPSDVVHEGMKVETVSAEASR